MPVDLIICGAAGRMGRTLISLAAADVELRLAAAVDLEGIPSIGKDAGEIAGVGTLGVPIASDFEAAVRPDAVTLDFTNAEGALAHLRTVVEKRAPIVIGSTGFNAQQRQELEALAQRTRAVVAANMSIGVNVLLMLVRTAARALGNSFDPEISEVHHRMKVDSPSGTALTLARAIAEELGRDLEKHGVYGREGLVGRRTDREIGVLGLRGGDAVGDHTVYFLGMGERLELTHRTQGRESLARGALRAAKWLAKQTNPGCYSMLDVLGFNPERS